jgi:hypothetical protein
MKRDEMIAHRTNLLRGVPPYEKDSMGNFIRGKGGTPGLHELQKMGDFNPIAATVRLSIETQIHLIDHMLERMK